MNIKLQQKKTSIIFFYKKDDELKGDNITDANDGITAYGKDFINCQIILDKDSTQMY